MGRVYSQLGGTIGLGRSIASSHETDRPWFELLQFP
jgi:hypothetical protein